MPISNAWRPFSAEQARLALRALSLGQKVAALEPEQLLAAQTRVGEHAHDRDIAQALHRVAGH